MATSPLSLKMPLKKVSAFSLIIFFLLVTLKSLLNSLNSRLCEWTCSPGLMLSKANQIIWSYFIIGSPLFIDFKQTLWPNGIGSIVLISCPSILVFSGKPNILENVVFHHQMFLNL